MDIPHLCVATPCFGGNVTHIYHTAMMDLAAAAADRGIGFSAIYTAGDSLVTRARNRLVNRFLAEPAYTHLLFIDADIGFTPDQVFRLLDSGHGVVGGIYPVKAVFWDRIAAAGSDPARRQALSLEYVVGPGPAPHEDDQGFLAVEDIGTGFLMIARPVLERLCACFPETRYFTEDVADQDFFRRNTAPVPQYALFDTRIDAATGRYLSEDYAFCALCRTAGVQVWADLTSQLRHTGPVTFAGDVAARLGRSAAA
jgi:hypothetical protein